MIGYPFALLLALLGKTNSYRWGLGLVVGGIVVALLGFRWTSRLSAASPFGDYSDVVGWSGIVLAIYGLIVLQFSIWATLARLLDRLRKDRD